jgi:hypothetical protein
MIRITTMVVIIMVIKNNCCSLETLREKQEVHLWHLRSQVRTNYFKRKILGEEIEGCRFCVYKG